MQGNWAILAAKKCQACEMLSRLETKESTLHVELYL